MENQIDHRLIAEAEAICNRDIHFVRSLLHRYIGSAKYLSQEEFEECEKELRAFVNKRRFLK